MRNGRIPYCLQSSHIGHSRTAMQIDTHGKKGSLYLTYVLSVWLWRVCDRRIDSFRQCTRRIPASKQICRAPTIEDDENYEWKLPERDMRFFLTCNRAVAVSVLCELLCIRDNYFSIASSFISSKQASSHISSGLESLH